MPEDIRHNMAHAVLDRLATWPNGSDAAALTHDGTTLSARDLHCAVLSRQAQLRGVGMDRGDVVVIATQRGNAFWIDMLAVVSMGACACPVEYDVAPERFAVILDRGSASWICGAFNPHVVGQLGQCRQAPEASPPAPGGAALAEGTAPVSFDATAVILFTSGSTGAPKGASLSHGALMANAQGTASRIQLTPSDRLFFNIPFRFVSALSHCLVGLLVGASVEGCEARFLQQDFCQRVKDSGCTAYGGSPLQARWISEGWVDAAQTADQPRLRWIMCSGDNLPEQVVDRLLSLVPSLTVVVAYGLTEVAGRLCCRIVQDGQRGTIDSVGQPIEGLRVSVLDEHGQPCAAGMVGLIWASGNSLLSGYVSDAVGTAAVLLGDSLRTGDVGFIDSEGSMHLVGREDDVFKVAGRKVSCVPIMSALLDTGIFADVAVIPRPHSIVGQVPHAIVAIRDGHVFDKGAVLRHLRHLIPADHLPRSFSFVDRIPRTGSGKVDRSAVKTRAMLEFG